jgi:hypothetical protein
MAAGKGVGQCDTTAFRVDDDLTWFPRVEPSRGGGATVQPWAGLPNPFRIAQGVDWSGLSCEGRFWERKLGPAKAYYL